MKKWIVLLLIAALFLTVAGPAALAGGETSRPMTAARLLQAITGLGEAPALPDEPAPGVYTAARLLKEQASEPTAPPAPLYTPEPVTPESVLAGMTLRQKVWQMIVVRTSELDAYTTTSVSGSMAGALADCPVGGFLFDLKNMSSQSQVRKLLSDLNDLSGIPLLTMCDEEGGTVSRLMRSVGTTRIGAMLDYKNDGPETAYNNAFTIASDMAPLGFNLDLAPVADVCSDPSSSVIGTRAYSDSFTQAAELIPAAVRGFHDGGVACTLKHFPGHGNTAEDSHDEPAYLRKSLSELREEEFLSFAAGIRAGADVVMLGHITVPELGSEPATFSYTLATEILRGELGFTGVIMTDALQMQAIAGRYGAGDTALRAVRAGADMLLCPQDARAAAEALIRAVEQGELSESRINESVLRILRLKDSLGLLG